MVRLLGGRGCSAEVLDALLGKEVKDKEDEA